jgi:hypothetical protein
MGHFAGTSAGADDDAALQDDEHPVHGDPPSRHGMHLGYIAGALTNC